MGKYVGRKAIIVDNTGSHGFANGEEVVLTQIYDEGTLQEHWKAETENQLWWVAAEEFKLVEEEV